LQKQTNLNILKKKVGFDDPCWKGFSEIGKKFLKQCLRKDPTQRITVEAALTHPWFSDLNIRNIRKFYYLNPSRSIEEGKRKNIFGKKFVPNTAKFRKFWSQKRFKTRGLQFEKIGIKKKAKKFKDQKFVKRVKVEESKEEVMTPCTVKKVKACNFFNELIAKPK